MNSPSIKYLILFLCSIVVFTSTANLLNSDRFSDTTAMPTGTITGSGNYCLNEPNVEVVFTGSGGSGVGNYTFNYNIDGDPGSISTTGGSTAVLPYDTSTIGANIYRLVSVSFNSGTDNTVNNQDQIFRTLPLPTADFSFLDDQCSGAPVAFTNNSSTGADITYLWDFGDGATSVDLNPVHTFDAVGCVTQNFNVILEVTRNGCTVRANKDITVKESPDLELKDISNPFNPFNNCSGTSSATNYEVTIDNTSTSTCVSNISINWGDGTVDTSPVFPLSHTYTTTGAFSLRILGDGDNGCSGVKEYIVKNVSNPKGGLNSPGTTQNLCAPTPDLQFAISNWGGNSADTSYNVDYGDGTIIVYTQTELEASASYKAADPIKSSPFPIPHSYLETNCPKPSYTLQLNINNACGSTGFTVANITVLSPPEADFINPPEACVNTSVLFDNLSEAGFGISCNQEATYRWDFGDGTPVESKSSSAPEKISHTYTTPGNYEVTLTATGYCGSDSVSRMICIEPELVPVIAYSNAEGCSDLDVTVKNATDTKDFCSALTYNWNVTYMADFCSAGPSNFSFINGTDENSTTPQFNFVTPGRYTIAGTITGSSCGIVQIPQQEVLIKQPPTVTIDPINTICEGDGLSINPTAQIENCAPVSNNLTYAWSFPGATPPTATTAEPGTITYPGNGIYTISLSVTNECGTTVASNQNFTIFEDPIITGTLLQCAGETEQLTATGSPNPTNSWTSTDTTIATVDATGLVTTIIPGTVDITFTNDNGCTDTVSFEVTPGPSFTLQPLPNQDICLGGTPATLEVAFINGSGTVTYQWYENTAANTTSGTPISGANTSTYTPDASAVRERFFYVIISFSEGCPILTSDLSRLEVAPQPTITTQPITSQEVCVGASISSLIVTYQDGAGTPNYQWFASNINSNTGGTSIAGANSSNYSPPAYKSSGTYYYYVEVDFTNSGCGTLTSATAQVIVVDDPIITQQPLVSQEQCQGTAATQLTITASGGLGAFDYQWYQNSTNSNTGGSLIPKAISDSYQPLTDTVGTTYYYAVVSQPGLGCEALSDTAELTVVPSPAVDNQPVSADYCEGDVLTALTVTVANGVGTPVYQWFENTDSSNSGGTAISGATSASFSPPATLGISYYYVQVTYASGGCSLVTSEAALINVDQAPVIADESIEVCSGDLFTFTPDNTGGNIFNISTKYTWSVPTISPAGTISGATAQSISQPSVEQQLVSTASSVATVIYIVTPTSGTCEGSPFQLEVQVLPKPEVVFSQADQTICSGSTTTAVNVSSNFTTNVSFEWTASIPTGITGAAATGTDVIPSQTLVNSTSAPLTVIYSAKAIYLNGSSSCEGVVKYYSIVVQSEINATGTISDYNGFGVSANGVADGFIDLTVTGGSGSYTFDWTGPGSFTASAEDISNLVSGDYQVVINDGVCPSVQLDFTLTTPPELLFSEDLAAHRDLDCFGGTNGELAVVITQASVGPYDFELIDENGLVVFIINNSADLRQEFSNLSSQVYSVRITDSNDAAKILNGLEITQPSQILITSSKTPIRCFLANDASIRIEATGGAGSYTASWSNLATGFFQDNLAAGVYTITVTDSNLCTEEISVIIEEAPVFFTAPTFSNISCFGANDGSIKLNLTGGVAPVNLSWSDGSTQGTTRNNLGPGTYTATIKDSTPCTIVKSFTIIEPQLLALDGNITNALDCEDANSGAINLLVSGGTAPFSYNWSNGSTTEDLTNLPPANYQVNVTDANGCISTQEFKVTGNTPIKLTLDDRLEIDCEAETAQQILTAQISGGVAPYRLQWSSGTSRGDNNKTLTTDQNGLVILTVTDAIGCERSVTFNVDLPEIGDPSFDSDSIGYSTYGSYSIQDPIQFTDTSTGIPMEISWDFGDGSFSNEVNPVHVYATPGQHTVVQSVTYGNGCVRTNKVTLEITKGYKLVMPNAFTPNGDRMNDLFRPSQEGLEKLQFSVYDSWGSLIHSEEGETIAGWDGTRNNRNTENGNFYFKFTATTFYGKDIAAEGSFTKID